MMDRFFISHLEFKVQSIYHAIKTHFVIEAVMVDLYLCMRVIQSVAKLQVNQDSYTFFPISVWAV